MGRRPVKHNKEIRRRIRIAVAAFAYEIMDDPVMDDAEFDRIAREIDPDQPTGNALLDKFFMIHFEPDTGQWVHKHPEIDKLRFAYENYFPQKTTEPDPDWSDLI